ncbi:hypothetical protein [Micromonospora sp. NPDC050495]|uniref:hypothetical protein n=1 Tax=Micromonospora sp. NPDC050495 TaxID=3154936 RepID=UPI00341148AC
MAVGVAALLVVVALSEDRAATDLDPLGYAQLAAGGLALALRRRAPVAVLVLTGLCAVGYQAARFNVFAVAYLVAVYSAMRAGRRTATVATSVAMLVALPLAAMLAGRHDAGAAFAQARGVLELAWLIAAGAAGEALRQAEGRADEAERSREETALRRAGEERLPTLTAPTGTCMPPGVRSGGTSGGDGAVGWAAGAPIGRWSRAGDGDMRLSGCFGCDDGVCGKCRYRNDHASDLAARR